MDGKLNNQDRRSFIKTIAGIFGICFGILKIPVSDLNGANPQPKLTFLRENVKSVFLGDIFTIEGVTTKDGCLRQFVVTSEEDENGKWMAS